MQVSKAIRRLFLLVVVVAGISGVLYPVVQSLRSQYRLAARRGRLGMFLIAIENYRGRHGCIPPAFITDKDGTPEHSWRVLLLPYFERGDVLARYHFDEPWNGPRNKLLLGAMPADYQFPGCERNGNDITNYVMVVGPGAGSEDKAGTNLPPRIAPSTELKCLVIEFPESDIKWMEPRDLTVSEAIKKVHGGTLFVGSDRSIHEIPGDASPEAIRAFFDCSGTSEEGIEGTNVPCTKPR